MAFAPAVPYQVVAWRTDLAPVPENPGAIPLPGTLGFESVKGRQGDLLILQVRSGSHLTEDKQQALKDLELGKIGSASIRLSSGDNIGRIQLLRGILAVVDLRGVKYKDSINFDEKTGLEYERIKFGSNTQPGELLRDSSNNYFVFESDRNGILVNWSTNQSVSQAYKALSKTFINNSFSTGPGASVVGLEETSAGNNGFNDDVDVLSLTGPDAVELIKSRPSEVAFARVSFKAMDFTWHQPYERFDDRENVSAELGLYFRTSNLVRAAGYFARSTGNATFFDTAQCQVVMREQGIVRIIPF